MTPWPAITELVPHTAPMLAVDELLDWEPGYARVRLVIKDTDLFLRDGEVEGVCALEYMAQGVAACLGEESYKAGDSLRVGMVIACRKMNLHRASFRVGEEFVLEARCVRASGHASNYDTEMRTPEGQLVADATMTLVHGERPPA